MDEIEVRAFVDASRAAVIRALAEVRTEAARAEALRAAEHRAFMAESREADARRERDHADALREMREALALIKDGEPGRDGTDGKDGRDGIDGPAGPEGPAGPIGPQGEQGLPGDIGVPGRDGIDGMNGKDGADAYHGEARGLFDPGAVYRALDVVSFNGSEWRAKYDEPGELPGNGWMLSACRGKKGEPGKGIPGANLVAAYVERGTGTLVLTRDDGLEIKADLSGLVEAATERANA